MRSQRTLLVITTSILLASFGCEGEEKGSEMSASGGQAASSSVGSTPATRDNNASSSDPTRGSGGSSSSPGATSRSGTSGATSETVTASGGQLGGASGGTSGKPPSNGGANSDGGKSSSGIGSKSAAGGGGTTNTSVGGNAPKGGSPPTSVVQAAGGTRETAAPCTAYGKHAEAGSMGITTNDKTQISGIVASREHSGILYAQADSGQAVLHVMDATGKLLGSMSLNVTPKDWEDLSMGINPTGVDYIYVADIGDNPARTGSGAPRTSILVYRFPEPARSSFSTATPLAISTLEKAEFTYPNGVHDAETLMVDPTTQDMLILTKDENGKSIVYRAPDSAFKSTAPTKLEEVVSISTGASGQLDSQVSAGDISPSGDAVMLRTYGSLLLFPRLATWAETFAATPFALDSPTEQQGEGLTFTSDGKAWISAGETSTALYSAQATCD